MYQRVISAMKCRGVRPESIGASLINYAEKELTKKASLWNVSGQSRPDVIAGAGSNERIVVETIVSLLPVEKLVVPLSFLFGLLRSAILLDCSVACRLDLERRIGSQLDMATLDDLLIPSFRHAGDTLFDVDTVHRILVNFSQQDDSEEELENVSVFESESPQSPSQGALFKVSKLVVRGKDPDDLSSRNMPFGDPFDVDLTKLTVGYLDDSEKEVVNVLASKGVNMVPFQLNYTVDSVQGILNFTMDVDMLAHFDEWQRSGLDDEYEAQDQWPSELRRARVVTAVDYMQAQRARGRLIQEVRESFTVDAFIGNATDWEKVCMGNLVGMPVMVIPVGFDPIANSTSTDIRRRTTVTTGIYAPPQHDHIALALAIAFQSRTDYHKQRPPIDDLGPNDSISNTPSTTYPPRQLRA